MEEARALAERLAAGPTRSYAGSKRALNRMLYGDMDEQLDLEAEIQHELARTKDFLEGVSRVRREARAARLHRALAESTAASRGHPAHGAGSAVSPAPDMTDPLRA